MYKNAQLIRTVLDYADEGENLFVFVDTESDSIPWQPVDVAELFNPFDDRDFFLCLPKHMEAVINSLNGGDSEVNYGGDFWTECNCDQPVKWESRYWYMVENCDSRIKPKKEKRWIAYKFKDFAGNSVQASSDGEGFVDIHAPCGVLLTPDQAIEFAKQLTELAQEVKGNEHS